MTSEKLVPPSLNASAFTCPNCSAYARQRWSNGHVNINGKYLTIADLFIGQCDHCTRWHAWLGPTLVYPAASAVPKPNADLSADIKRDYQEAAAVVSASPRAACALLRLAVQKLCKELGEPGKNINDDVGSLVKKGLPERFAKALDIVRVVGNNAVHPGEMDLTDDAETALKLFTFVNLLADAMLTQPKNINALFDALPDGAKAAIKKRDS